MILLVKIAVVLAGLYVLLWLGARALEHRLTYYPDPLRTAPSAAGLAGVEERTLATPDGATIIAWYGRSRPGQPTILYFHGNAGSLADRAERIARYLGRGCGVYIMAYRSFAGSTGKPSERANVADAKIAYADLAGLGVAPKDLILYGESLGTGVAVQVAAQLPVAGIILDSPYTTLLDVALHHYPHLPSRLFMTDRYETVRFLPRIRAPLFVVHGREDRVVPVEMGIEVHAQAPGPKEIALIARAGHSDHATFGSSEAIFDWIGRLRAGRIAAAGVRAAE